MTHEEIRKRLDELPCKLGVPRDIDHRNEWWIIHSPGIVNSLLSDLTKAKVDQAAAQEALEDARDNVKLLVESITRADELVAKDERIAADQLKERDDLRAKLDAAMTREARLRDSVRAFAATEDRTMTKREHNRLREALYDKSADAWLAAQKAAVWREVIAASRKLDVNGLYRLLGDKAAALEAQENNP